MPGGVCSANSSRSRRRRTGGEPEEEQVNILTRDWRG